MHGAAYRGLAPTALSASTRRRRERRLHSDAMSSAVMLPDCCLQGGSLWRLMHAKRGSEEARVELNLHECAHREFLVSTANPAACVGILINAATALLFASGRKGDLNIRGAYLHMVADAAVSAGVVIAGAVVMLTAWAWVDPAVSLIVCAAIVWSTWRLLRGSISMSLDAVPEGIDAVGVRAFLERLPGVSEIHDLHIWPISTTETAMTAHLVMHGGFPGDQFLVETQFRLRQQFRIAHATLQIETGASACELAPNAVI